MDALPPIPSSARLLVSRLERLSADSYWAHQASGLRGALLRCLGDLDALGAADPAGWQSGLTRLEALSRRGFELLTLAARELPVPDDWRTPPERR